MAATAWICRGVMDAAIPLMTVQRARTEKGPFKDIFDFCERIDLHVVSRAAIERLIKAGAFDGLGAWRSQWMAVLPKALQAAGEVQQDRRAGQLNFLDILASNSADPLPATQGRAVVLTADSEGVTLLGEGLMEIAGSKPALNRQSPARALIRAA